MTTEKKDKKSSVSFSLSDRELAEIMERASYLKFRDRSEYLIALLRFDQRINLECIPAWSTQERTLVLPHRFGQDPLREVELVRMQLNVATHELAFARASYANLWGKLPPNSTETIDIKAQREAVEEAAKKVELLDQKLELLINEMSADGAEHEMAMHEANEHETAEERERGLREIKGGGGPQPREDNSTHLRNRKEKKEPKGA